jgi:hypothetical protein
MEGWEKGKEASKDSEADSPSTFDYFQPPYDFDRPLCGFDASLYFLGFFYPLLRNHGNFSSRKRVSSNLWVKVPPWQILFALQGHA